MSREGQSRNELEDSVVGNARVVVVTPHRLGDAARRCDVQKSHRQVVADRSLHPIGAPLCIWIHNELVASNEAMQRFAYTAAHDLRTPLNAALNLTRLLAIRTDEKLDEQEREMLRNSSNAC